MFLLGTSSPNAASIKDYKGAIRMTDVNNVMNPWVLPSGMGAPQIYQIGNNLISLGFNHDEGVTPWVFKNGEDAPRFIDIDRVGFSTPHSASTVYIQQYDQNRVVFQTTNDKQNWITDGTTQGTTRWMDVEHLNSYLLETEGSYPITNFVRFVTKLENGNQLLLHSSNPELWKVDVDNNEFIALSQGAAPHVINHDKEHVLFRSRSNGVSSYFSTDGTMPGTKELLRLPENIDRFTRGYGNALANPSKRVNVFRNFYISYRNLDTNKYSMYRFSSKGNVTELLKGSDYFPYLDNGVVDNNTHTYFASRNEIYSYSEESKSVEKLPFSPDKTIYSIKLIRLYKEKLVIQVTFDQGNTLPSYYYLYNPQIKSFVDITNNGDDLYLMPVIAGSNDNSLFVRVNSFNGGTYPLIKFSVETEKFSLVNQNIFSPWPSFMFNNRLYTFGSSQEHDYGLYFFNEETKKMNLTYMADRNRKNYSSFIDNIFKKGDNLYFTGWKSEYSTRHTSKKTKYLWEVRGDEVITIAEGRYDTKRVLFGDKLYYHNIIDSNNEIYSYSPDTGSKLVFEGDSDLYEIMELVEYKDNKIYIKVNSNLEPFRYLDLNSGLIKNINYQGSHYEKMFSCGNDVFISSETISGKKLYLVDGSEISEVPNFSSSYLDYKFFESKSTILHYQEGNLRAFDCNTKSNIIVYENIDTTFTSWDAIDGIGNEIYLRVGSNFYNVDVSNGDLFNLNNVPASFIYWYATQKGTFVFKQEYNVDRSDWWFDLYKLENGTFNFYKTLEHKFSGTSSPDDKNGWIIGNYTEKGSISNTELAIYIPNLNETVVIDLFEGTTGSLPRHFFYFEGKYYFSTYQMPNIGGELGEIKIDCFEVMYVGNSCSSPLSNHPPVIAKVRSLTLEPKDYFYQAFRAVDPEYDEMIYSVTGHPNWLNLNSRGELYGWVPDHENGSYQIQLIVHDGQNETVHDVFTLTIEGNSNNQKSNSSKSGGGIFFWPNIFLLYLALRFKYKLKARNTMKKI